MSEQEKKCACGHDDCNCGHEEEFDTVTLTFEDDEEVVCAVLRTFEVMEKEYIALVPLTEDGEMEEDLYLYRFIDHEEEPELITIEDDEEYEAVADAMDEWFDELDFEDAEVEE